MKKQKTQSKTFIQQQSMKRYGELTSTVIEVLALATIAVGASLIF